MVLQFRPCYKTFFKQSCSVQLKYLIVISISNQTLTSTSKLAFVNSSELSSALVAAWRTRLLQQQCTDSQKYKMTLDGPDYYNNNALIVRNTKWHLTETLTRQTHQKLKQNFSHANFKIYQQELSHYFRDKDDDWWKSWKPKRSFWNLVSVENVISTHAQ